MKKNIPLGFALGWVYISNEERKKTADLLDVLSNPGTVDELGISPIRDWFSEQLFPGFSTTQRRVKYFIQVPKLLAELAQDKEIRTRKQVEDALHKKEWDYVKTFKEDFKALEKKGIIGSRNYDRNLNGLNRYPSELYWSGLVTTGIVTDTHASLNRIFTDISQSEASFSQKKNDEESRQSLSSFLSLDKKILTLNWDASTIELNKEEADYLYDIFVNGKKTKNSLTPIFLKQKKVPKNLAEFYSLDKTVFGNNLELYKTWQKAVNFAKFIHGAHIAYNYLLTKNNKYLEEYESWLDSACYDIQELSGLPQNTKNAASFVKTFLDCVCDVQKTSNHQKIFDCIVNWESSVKIEKAKLIRNITSKDGVYEGMMHYRFNVAKQACDDILRGRKKNGK